LELQAISAYVAQFSPLAAQRLAVRLISAARSLETAPDRGRPISRGRRELAVIRPYLIRYIRNGERLIILELRHAAQEPE
jgi:plasmid stabilization system protein ParE